MSDTVIYPARAIHTLDDPLPGPIPSSWSRPVHEAIAVRDGHILGLGSVEELKGWGPATVDDTLADKVLLPGFVEAHCHSFAGSIWASPYCGYFDRYDPEGRLWAGSKSIGEVVERLREADAAIDDPNEPLCAWGLDPIYFDGERLVAHHLDAVSTTRQIFVIHASFHLATVNTALMEAQGIDADTQMEGVPKDGEGNPIGELQEPAAMSLAGEPMRQMFRAMSSESGIWSFGHLARNCGVTTLTDLGASNLLSDGMIDSWRKVVDDPAFPARVSMFLNPGFAGIGDPVDAVAAVRGVAERSSDKLRLGHVKLVMDGSIQGFTARMRWPGHYGGQPNGLWLMPPEQLAPMLTELHRAGVLVHIHCNGDEAVDVFLDAMDVAQAEAPRPDHRHTVQHCQLTTPAQYRRMKAHGMCANIFSNHIFYWGDQHAAQTIGPDRAARMDACATALATEVPFAIHSDAAVTPLGSLHVAWCAVNRLTASGKVLGPDERIGVREALQAITLGAAYQLKMDHEIGSLEHGKRADIAVLEADPFEVDPVELKDIGVWGTMLGGDLHPASVATA